MDKKIIPLTRDFMFSEVFNNPDNVCILESFLASYLDIPIGDIKGNVKILSRRLPNQSKREARKEVDVLLKLKDKKIIIEMNTSEFSRRKRDRNLIYASKVLSQEYKKGDNKLENVLNVHQINFATETPRLEKRKLKYLINEYELRGKYDPEELFSKKLKIDIIDMEKSNNPCYTYIDKREEITAKWCRLMYTESLKYLKEEGSILMDDKTLEKLTEEVEKLSEDEEMVRLESEYTMQEWTHMANILDAKEESYEEGVESGISKGIEQNQFDTVRRMVEDKMPMDKIQKYTGLTTEKLNDIIGLLNNN